MQPLQICISPIIRIGRESWCLPYAGFFKEVVDSVKILGTVFNKELTWTENCSVIIRKVNARMQLLQKVLGFGATHKEMVELWKTYCRSVLEQSCIVWGSSLTEENKKDLERTQKTFTKLILGDKYTTYQEACKTLFLESLEDRRQKLTLTFAKQSLLNEKMLDLLPKRKQLHQMNTRKPDYYKVFRAKTKRYQNSPVILMQKLINQERK